jgi:pSer/pThr/pTyr-binding forkhead associated (FHA) protein
MQLDSKKIRELMKLNTSESKDNVDAKRADSAKKRAQIAMLSYLSGNKKDVRLMDNLIKIGKDAKSDVLVKGFGVGKTAAVINKMANDWYISYVRGLSKPQVNSAPLKKAVKLNNFDIITIGSTELQFILGYEN